VTSETQDRAAFIAALSREIQDAMDAIGRQLYESYETPNGDAPTG